MSVLGRSGRLSAAGLTGRPWTIKVVRGLAGDDVFLVREEGLGRVLVAKVVITSSARERDIVVAEAAAWRKIGLTPAACPVSDNSSPGQSTGAALTAVAAMAGSLFATPTDHTDSGSLVSYSAAATQDRAWRHLVRLEDVLVVSDSTTESGADEKDAVVLLMEQCLELTRERVNTEERILRAIAHVAAAIDDCWEATRSPFAVLEMKHCFIAEDYRVKIGGFGLTRAQRLLAMETSARSSEQRDILDIGILLFELIFAKPPQVNDDGSSPRIPKNLTAALATPRLVDLLRFAFTASPEPQTSPKRKQELPSLLDLRYHIAAARGLVPPMPSPGEPSQADSPPTKHSNPTVAAAGAPVRGLATAAAAARLAAISNPGHQPLPNTPQPVASTRNLSNSSAVARTTSAQQIGGPIPIGSTSKATQAREPTSSPGTHSGGGTLKSPVLSRSAPQSTPQHPSKVNSIPRTSSLLPISNPRVSGTLANLAAVPNKPATHSRTMPTPTNGPSGAVRGLAAAARSNSDQHNGQHSSSTTRHPPGSSSFVVLKEDTPSKASQSSPTNTPAESTTQLEHTQSQPSSKSQLTRSQLASKAFREKLVSIIMSDSRPIRTHDLDFVIRDLGERKLASSDIYETLYQQNISKDPVAAFKATLIILAGLRCGHEYFVDTTHRQREYVAWVEECYSKDRMAGRSARKRHQHHESFINGEIAILCTCARRKSQFSVESEPGITGTWALKHTRTSWDWRSVRRIMSGIYDLLDAIEKSFRLITPAEDSCAQLKLSAVPILLADAVESYAMLTELVKGLPQEDRGKCMVDFSACHQSLKSIVEAVRSRKEVKLICLERHLEPIAQDSPFSPPTTNAPGEEKGAVEAKDSDLSVDRDMMKKLTQMGFSSSDASRTLKKTNNDLSSAVVMLSDKKGDHGVAKKKKQEGSSGTHEFPAVPAGALASATTKEPTKVASIAASKNTTKRRKPKSEVWPVGPDNAKAEDVGRTGHVKNGDVGHEDVLVETKPAAVNNFRGEDLTKMDPIYEVDPDEITLQEEIGRGGFGTVFKGRISGKRVAVKKIHPQSLNSRNALEEFQREIAVLCRLQHPNILLFMGACSKPPDLMIITEFMANGTLFDLLHRSNKRLTWKKIVGFALDVCHGLLYLHRSHLLHRDIKSSNMMLDDDLVVKVGDFGLTRVVSKAAVPMTGQTGTFQYMAPEVLSSRPYSEKADVFSFGILLWEIVARKLPYFGMQPMQVGIAVVNQRLRPTVPPDCPNGLSRLMKQCWDQDPLRRPSLDIVIRLLDSIDL